MGTHRTTNDYFTWPFTVLLSVVTEDGKHFKFSWQGPSEINATMEYAAIKKRNENTSMHWCGQISKSHGKIKFKEYINFC